MKPLVCFYKDENYIISTEYELLACPDEKSISLFLNEIENKFYSDLKIVQINFEHEDLDLFSKQQKLYPSSKANVFILKKYKLKPLEEICKIICSNYKEKTELNFQTLMSRNEFIEKTKYIIEQIKKGRIYQANLTSPLKSLCQIDSQNLFCQYQTTFKGSYKALLPCAEYEILSFSPELFLQQENGELITRPIKGSLKVESDFSKNLIGSEKETAELSMIVDLLRNDLNSLSDDHSSIVKIHREKMQLGYIQHTYSEIFVKCSLPLSDVLKKTFPGGSISGCPKTESLHVIREVETYKRQAYTGSLGWWKENDFKLNITIRSLIKFKDQLFYHAGCGIVYDSDPEQEWQEFLLKTGSFNVV